MMRSLRGSPGSTDQDVLPSDPVGSPGGEEVEEEEDSAHSTTDIEPQHSRSSF